jgi:hypothetical protein
VSFGKLSKAGRQRRWQAPSFMDLPRPLRSCLQSSQMKPGQGKAKLQGKDGCGTKDAGTGFLPRTWEVLQAT